MTNTRSATSARWRLYFGYVIMAMTALVVAHDIPFWIDRRPVGADTVDELVQRYREAHLTRDWRGLRKIMLDRSTIRWLPLLRRATGHGQLIRLSRVDMSCVDPELAIRAVEIPGGIAAYCVLRESHTVRVDTTETNCRHKIVLTGNVTRNGSLVAVTVDPGLVVSERNERYYLCPDSHLGKMAVDSALYGTPLRARPVPPYLIDLNPFNDRGDEYFAVLKRTLYPELEDDSVTVDGQGREWAKEPTNAVAPAEGDPQEANSDAVPPEKLLRGTGNEPD